MSDPEGLQQAARAIRDADALLITAGAGMGVNSGLPDFRSDHGFWRAYPPFEEMGLSFYDLARPEWFADDPELAWGFYGHRLNLYRRTRPHDGFRILRRWAASRSAGAFVFTSNVDGQFQKAGFPDEQIAECHGSLHHLQCTRFCSDRIWTGRQLNLEIDETTCRARSPLPLCPDCGAVARPNILLFGDWGWVSRRSDKQGRYLDAWLTAGAYTSLVVIECGAGTAIPTVRLTGERLAGWYRAPLIRINPNESEGPVGVVCLAMGARDALQELDRLIKEE